MLALLDLKNPGLVPFGSNLSQFGDLAGSREAMTVTNVVLSPVGDDGDGSISLPDFESFF